MSRIGKKAVPLPSGVKVTLTPNTIVVEGPRGKLAQEYLPEVSIKVDNSMVMVTRKSDTRQARACHGLYRNLINNMVIGVSTGFKKSLIISGVGYKAELQGPILVLSLGYSSDFGVAIPSGIKALVEANGQKIVLESHDYALLGKFASEIRSLRQPEPYKGKGISYENEVLRKKVGKTGVK